MPRNRREFLKLGLAATGAAGLGLYLYHAHRERPPLAEGYGPLRPVRDATTGFPLLELPGGFSYRTFSWAGDPLSDGRTCPDEHDGMGIVREQNGRVTLVRNHERRAMGPLADPANSYDVIGGGTTTLVFNTASARLEESRVSLSGTLHNCAGGVTPWGTWLSCEEGVWTPDLVHLGITHRQRHWRIGSARRTHGWVFEVGPEGLAAPEPLGDMGQFYHEAAAVDPSTGDIYMTEDASPQAGFYRFVPRLPGRLSDGGRLQMLRVEGVSELNRDLSALVAAGAHGLAAEWVDIGDPRRGHTPGTHDCMGVVRQGLDEGATAFVALEGGTWSDGSVYFTSKLGGASGQGAMFRFVPATSRLHLVYETPGASAISGPDNIVMSPRGSLLVCEDRVAGSKMSQRLAGLTPDGELFHFCRVNPALGDTWNGHDLGSTLVVSEWAGACFSADGQWLFANIHVPGVSVAITGPWVSGLV